MQSEYYTFVKFVLLVILHFVIVQVEEADGWSILRGRVLVVSDEKYDHKFSKRRHDVKMDRGVSCHAIGQLDGTVKWLYT